MDIEHRYKNKYFSILGDSISTLAGYSQPKFAVYYDANQRFVSNVSTRLDTWWGQVIQRCGGELLVNNSWSGSTVCWHPEYEVPSYGCSDERTSALGGGDLSPDVIFVFLGTNDWGFGFPISSQTEENDGVFSIAYGKMLQKLRKNYPNAEIWCLTLPIGDSAEENLRRPSSRIGRQVSDYCEAIRVCAMENGCRVIDVSHKLEAHNTVDGCHPKANGMKTLADAVLDGLFNIKTLE